MDFDLSEAQKMLAAETRKLLGEMAPPARLRALADEQAWWDFPLWRAVSDMGLTGAAIPQSFGGVGLDEIDLCVICEEMGRVPAPVPFFSSICQAAEAIRLAGSEDQKSIFLPRLASGEAIGVYAWHENGNLFEAAHMSMAARAGRLTGTKSPVADAKLGHFAVVAAAEEGDAGLYLVKLDQPGVSITPLEGFDQLRRHASIRLEDVEAQRLPGSSLAFTQQMETRSAVYAAFEQIGGAESCLYMARDYAMQRQAFGRPVASYQSIKHKLADIYLEIELARSNAYYAGWALATAAPDLPEAAAAARLSAGIAYDLASRENLHVHGGFGYTWEANCHFHYRRARLLSAFLGNADLWSTRLIAALKK